MPSIRRGGSDTTPCSKMRTMAPTYQQITVDLCRTTPSGILSEAVSQAEEEAKARLGRRGVKAR